MAYGHVEKKRILDGLIAAGFDHEFHVHRQRGWPAVLWKGRLVVRFEQNRQFSIYRLETSPEVHPRRSVKVDRLGAQTGRGWAERTIAGIVAKCEALS